MQCVYCELSGWLAKQYNGYGASVPQQGVTCSSILFWAVRSSNRDLLRDDASLLGVKR